MSVAAARAAAISGKQILLGENTSSTPDANQVPERMVVLETSELSRVEQAW